MKPNKKKYTELAEAMKNHMILKPLTGAAQSKLTAGSTEREVKNIARFIAELRKLTETCDFGAKLDKQLKDRMVEWLRNKSIHKRLREILTW